MNEIEHIITPPSGRRLGYQCSCGEKFPNEALANKHVVDAAFKPESKEEPVAPKKSEVKETKKQASTEDVPAKSTAPRATSKVQKFLDNADVRARFEDLLDKRASQFITSLTALVGTNSKLSECTPQTFLSAAVTAAALDLPINPNLGFAYIIPYKNKGVMEAQFQMGYKGFIQLAQRSGQYKTIGATPVYEGQLLSENPLTGNEYDWKAKKSDKVIGYVGYFKLLNGFEKDLYMSVEEATKHGKKYSQSMRSGFGLWKDEFDTMATKTVLKLLISKFGPLSTDTQMAMAIERDQAVITEEGEEYVDNIGELQEKIEAAKDAKELQEILQGLTVEEKTAAQPIIESRLGEL